MGSRVATMVIVPTIMPLPKGKFTQVVDVPPDRNAYLFVTILVDGLAGTPSLITYGILIKDVSTYQPRKEGFLLWRAYLENL